MIQVYSGAHGRTMVFTGTKAEANELALNAVLKQECQVREYDVVLLVLVLNLVPILALLISFIYLRLHDLWLKFKFI